MNFKEAIEYMLALNVSCNFKNNGFESRCVKSGSDIYIIKNKLIATYDHQYGYDFDRCGYGYSALKELYKNNSIFTSVVEILELLDLKFEVV